MYLIAMIPKRSVHIACGMVPCGIFAFHTKVMSILILPAVCRKTEYWHKTARSISISGAAKYGIIREKSKIAPPVDFVWLEAIEIIPLESEPATCDYYSVRNGYEI